MEETPDDLSALIDLYISLDSDIEKVAVLEKAITIAENIKDYEVLYFLRAQLVDVGIDAGCELKAMMAFSKNLKYADENPDNIDWFQLLIAYKWIINVAVGFYQVSLDQIKEMLEDFKRRLLEYGDGLSAYYTMFCAVYEDTGDLDKLKEYHALRKEHSGGELDDCPVCKRDAEVTFEALLFGFERAKAVAQDIFDNNMTCNSVPRVTYGTLSVYALKEGKIEQAEYYRSKEYSLIDYNQRLRRAIGFHIITFVAQDNVSEALALFKKYYLKSLGQETNGISFFNFQLGAYLLFEHLSLKNEQDIRFSFSVKGVCEKEEAVKASVLATHFKNKTEEYASAFDQRNQNDAFTNEIKTFRKLLKHI